MGRSGAARHAVGLPLEGDVASGTVNASRRHYEQVVGAMARAHRAWLVRLITRRAPLGDWREAIYRWPDDVKTVIDLTL